MDGYTPDKLFTYGTSIVALVSGILFGFKKFRKEKKVNACENCGLCRHKLFQTMDSFLCNIETNDWKCINNYKTEIAKDMIRIKLRVGKKRITDWVCKNKNVENSSDLCNDFNDMIVSMIHEYESMWLSSGINPIIVKKLSTYHNNNARYAVKMGKSELNREYNDTVNSLHHLLDTLIVPYSMFIVDIRTVMDSFNGQLKGDIYKGIVNSGEYKEIEVSKLSFSFEKEDVL